MGLSAGTLTLGVPALEVHDVFPTRELQQYGLEQRTELRLPVLHVVF
jgi:hypothetical protein